MLRFASLLPVDIIRAVTRDVSHTDCRSFVRSLTDVRAPRVRRSVRSPRALKRITRSCASSRAQSPVAQNGRTWTHDAPATASSPSTSPHSQLSSTRDALHGFRYTAFRMHRMLDINDAENQRGIQRFATRGKSPKSVGSTRSSFGYSNAARCTLLSSRERKNYHS